MIAEKLKLDEASPAARSSLSSIAKTDWKWWIAGAVLSFLLASFLMTGWRGLVRIPDHPFMYSGDSQLHLWLIQRAIEGWIFDNPRSGYPFGSNFLDFPGSDTGDHLILKLIGSLTNSPHSAFNLFFLLGFPVTFVASFCVLRTVGLTRILSFTAAILFSFLSFHFQRLAHLFYTWYFVVPIFYYIALRIFYSESDHQKTKTGLIKRVLYAVGLMTIASFGVYYALFGAIIVFVAIASRTLRNFNSASIKNTLLVLFFVILGVLLNLAPNLAHRNINGPNPEVAQRNPAEAEIYGFKFAQLILPRNDHRNEFLAEIAENYSKSFPLINENSISALGIASSLGLVALLLVIFITLSGKQYDRTLTFVALVVLILFMFGTIGGFGAVFSLAVSPSIRGWNRVSVFISFGALLGLFSIMQNTLQSRLSKQNFTIISTTIAIFLMLGGLYDQTVPACAACGEQTSRSFRIEREFIHSIENSLPTGSAVYQLPYMPFPEVMPLHRLNTYALAAGFLHSNTLRWSYAGMKGRSGDLFYRALAQEPIQRQLDIIRKLGFAGIYVDRRGFADSGNSLVQRLTALLGTPPTLTRGDNEVVFFRLGEGKSRVNLDGLNPNQIMQKVGYVADQLGPRYEGSLAEGIDFTRHDIPTFVKDVQGLSRPEPWGRWSDANLTPVVLIDLRDQLPNRFDLVFSSRAFGPNLDKDLKIRIGSQVHYFKLQDGEFEYRKTIDLRGERVTRIEFSPPQPTSPKELEMSADGRKLGIGLTRLRFEE